MLVINHKRRDALYDHKKRTLWLICEWWSSSLHGFSMRVNKMVNLHNWPTTTTTTTLNMLCRVYMFVASWPFERPRYYPKVSRVLVWPFDVVRCSLWVCFPVYCLIVVWVSVLLFIGIGSKQQGALNLNGYKGC